ncbi:MAG TPA: hypothetical protein VK386_07115 [Acidimicrobiales bacterium]|nr:hypothetical protein [Acidimicrobiales bacterium]
MTLGERCDEIVRLIDETLTSCAPEVAARPVRMRPPVVAEVSRGELEDSWPQSA